MNMFEVTIEMINRGNRNIEFLNRVENLEPNLHLIVRFEREEWLLAITRNFCGYERG